MICDFGDTGLMKFITEKTSYKTLLLYVLFTITICFLFFCKTDYMLDELLTYNLANAEDWFQPVDGVVYSPADKPFIDAMASNGIFDLRHVWKQQENDTHPPFYYVLVHAVCTLFPGEVSMRLAGIINIVFALLTLFFYRKLLKCLINEENIVFALSVVFCFTAGVLEIIPFLRMYVMVMFFITAFSYLVIKNIERFGVKDYFVLSLVVVCGALTQYYFIVYACFVSLVLAAILIRQHRIKELINYCSYMVASGVIVYIIFPPIVDHLFRQGRGAESIDNIKSSHIDTQLKSYIDIISPRLFGGMIGFIVIIIAILILLDLINKNKSEDELICGFSQLEVYRILCLIVPSVLYVLFVAKSAPYCTDRYVSPIYAVLIASVWSLLYLSFRNVYGNEIIRNRIFSFLAVIVVIASLFMSRWVYLYRDSDVRLNNSKMYGANSQAIVLYDIAWMINQHYLEIKNCNSSVFYSVSSFQEFNEIVDVNDLPDNIAFFLIDMDSESFINEFLDSNKEYILSVDNGSWAYGHSYYLTKASHELN